MQDACQKAGQKKQSEVALGGGLVGLLVCR